MLIITVFYMLPVHYTSCYMSSFMRSQVVAKNIITIKYSNISIPVPLIQIQSEPFHQSSSYRPHAHPLAVDIHRNREKKTPQLDAAQSKEHRPRPLRVQPVDNE